MISPLVERALRFAAQAHAAQRRKADNTPYIAHPVAVAMMLQQLGCADTVVAAALLHDTVEDTPVTQAQIAAEFGPEVAGLVAACTEPDKALAWERRKAHTIAEARTAPLPVRLILAADKLHTLRQMQALEQARGAAAWATFRRDKPRQAWFYGELACALRADGVDAAVAPLFDALDALVAAVFGDGAVDVPTATDLAEG